MPEALMVNPHSPEDVADALKRALAMERPERVRRWRALNESVVREDVTAWRDAFVTALSRKTALKAAV
jgi:trehalose 6-phosphate synthase